MSKQAPTSAKGDSCMLANKFETVDHDEHSLVMEFGNSCYRRDASWRLSEIHADVWTRAPSSAH